MSGAPSGTRLLVTSSGPSQRPGRPRAVRSSWGNGFGVMRLLRGRCSADRGWHLQVELGEPAREPGQCSERTDVPGDVGTDSGGVEEVLRTRVVPDLFG